LLSFLFEEVDAAAAAPRGPPDRTPKFLRGVAAAAAAAAGGGEAAEGGGSDPGAGRLSPLVTRGER